MTDIVGKLQEFRTRTALLERDAGLTQYGGSRAALKRVKREIKMLSKEYHDLYKSILADYADDRTREVPKVPQLTAGNQTPVAKESGATGND